MGLAIPFGMSNPSYPMPPGAFFQVTTERCLVTWTKYSGSHASQTIDTKDLVAFVAKLESKDCYNISWQNA